MTPEGKVKKKIKDALTELGIYNFSPRGTVYGRVGVPDLIVCAAGWFVGIEVKAGKNKPTALQLLEHDRIRLAGGKAFVANEDNWQEVVETIQQLCSS